jgi:hypothetical protein
VTTNTLLHLLTAVPGTSLPFSRRSDFVRNPGVNGHSVEVAATTGHDWTFETHLGITPNSMRSLLSNWPDVDDTNDASDASLAINNALNDL